MSLGRKPGNTLVPRHILGHLNVLVDHLSRKDQILKTECNLNQTIVDRVFHLWGKPHVDLFALERNVKLATCMSPIPKPMSWKVDSLVQSWRSPYAYVYPPTSFIRACLSESDMPSDMPIGRRGHSDRSLLAKSGVVPQTSRSHHRLSTHSSSKLRLLRYDMIRYDTIQYLFQAECTYTVIQYL